MTASKSRRIPPEQKAQLFDKCRKFRQEGRTMRDIAAELGVSYGTVCAWLAKMGDSAGEASRQRTARLQDRCLKLRREGHRQADIATELGINQTTVSTWLAKMGEPQTSIRKPRAKKVTSLPPPRDEEPILAYRHSVTLILLDSISRELREVNAEHCFAGDVADARECGDTTWLNNAKITLESAQAYMDRLHAVLNDEQARSADIERRDDVAQIAQYRHRKDKNDRPWTEEEREVLTRSDLSVQRMAQLLGRSRSSVHNARYRMLRDGQATR